MSRTLIEFAHWNLKELGSTNADHIAGKARVSALRDELRSRLDKNWLVGDIVEWQGNQSYHHCAAFAVYHRTGGQNSGHGWLFIIPTQYDLDKALGNGDRDIYNPYMHPITTTSSIGYGGAIIMYHPEAGTTDGWAMGYQVDANGHPTGTHPNGDFATPTKSPYSDISSFFQADVYVGICANNNIPLNNKSSHYATMIWDSDEPFFALYASRHYDWTFPRFCYVSGNLLENYDSSDTDKTAALTWEFDSNRYNENGRPENEYFTARLANGSVSTFQDYYDSAFGPGNSPDANDEYPWEPVAIKNGSYYKGRLNPALFRQIGWYRREFGQIFSGPSHPMIKLHEAYTFPWVAGIPSPYGGHATSDYVIV